MTASRIHIESGIGAQLGFFSCRIKAAPEAERIWLRSRVAALGACVRLPTSQHRLILWLADKHAGSSVFAHMLEKLVGPVSECTG